MRIVLMVCALAILGCQSGSEPATGSHEPLRSAEHAATTEPAPAEPEPHVEVPDGPTEADLPPRLHEEDNSDVIQFSPADLATSTDGTFPTVHVPLRGLGEGEAADLAAQFDLVTWPEREVVPTTPLYVDDAMAEGPTHARIVLEPREALSDRWYAIRARLERGRGLPRLRTRSRSDDYVITGSEAFARFRVGSQPIVQRVDVTADSEGRAWLTVQFSEPMRIEGDRSPIVASSEGRAVACTLSSPAEVRDEGGSLAFRFGCEGVRPGASVAVAFAPDALPISVRTFAVDDTLVHEPGETLLSAASAEAAREVFSLTIPRTPEARLVSPSASAEQRVARWYTATSRSMFGLDEREALAASSAGVSAAD